MNRAISAVHLVSKHSAEFFWRDTENDFISILCSSLTGKLFTISCFFLVVYRWHNIITAKLSSIQSAICFPVIEALLLICRESSRGEGGGGRGEGSFQIWGSLSFLTEERASKGKKRSLGRSLSPPVTLILSLCVSVSTELLSVYLRFSVLLLNWTCLPPSLHKPPYHFFLCVPALTPSSCSKFCS